VNTAPCNASTVYFKQINDIDLGGSGSPWTSIAALSGQYNGDGHKITGLYQNNATANDGLFNTINATASISNLNIENASITTSAYGPNVGILASLNYGTVANVASSGTVNVSTVSSVGGLIGSNASGSVSNSSSSATMNILNAANGQFVGNIGMGGLIGAAGTSAATTISLSYASGSIIGTIGTTTGNGETAYIGGLIGTINGNVTLNSSYTTENINISNSFLGRLAMGFVAYANGGTMATCFDKAVYRTVNVWTNSGIAGVQIGGMIGWAGGAGVIVDNSYVMSTIDSTGNNGNGYTAQGGFYGRTGNGSGAITISTSYSAAAAITASGGASGGFVGNTPFGRTLVNDVLYKTASIPADTSTGLTSYTTSAQMENQSNYTGFDFATPIWVMPTANPLAPAGLLSPVLKWQCNRNGITCP
jgi:hypothetical protein